MSHKNRSRIYVVAFACLWFSMSSHLLQVTFNTAVVTLLGLEMVHSIESTTTCIPTDARRPIFTCGYITSYYTETLGPMPK